MKENHDKRINPTSTNQSILYCKVYSQLLVSGKQMNEISASLYVSAFAGWRRGVIYHVPPQR